MADKRTLKQRIHDSEVKWDCYMRAYLFSDGHDIETALFFLREKAAGHEALLERYASEYRWWHRLLGIKRPVATTTFRDLCKTSRSEKVDKP